jgi:hypothetical protein
VIGREFRLHRNAAVRYRPRTPAPQPVTVTRPNPDAWKLALTLAGGDASRLVVVSENEIIVANNPRKGGT